MVLELNQIGVSQQAASFAIRQPSQQDQVACQKQKRNIVTNRQAKNRPVKIHYSGLVKKSNKVILVVILIQKCNYEY